jgi:hypothetical protein
MNLALVLALLIATQPAPSNDPVMTLPDSYKLQFENEWVKVVKVTYGPYVKLPAHSHTTWAAAYVYLNDADPVVFRHTDQEYHAITRPATKAKSFRVNRAMQEQHEVENTSARASEFLRVEFKTEQREPDTMRGRFYSVTPAPAAGFALGQERWIDGGQSLDLDNSGSETLEILRFDLKTRPVELTRVR